HLTYDEVLRLERFDDAHSAKRFIQYVDNAAKRLLAFLGTPLESLNDFGHYSPGYRKHEQGKERQLNRYEKQHGKVDDNGNGLLENKFEAVHHGILNLSHVVGETRYQLTFSLLIELRRVQPRNVATSVPP